MGFRGKHHTDQTKLVLQEKQVGCKSGRGKCGWYKGYWCQSSWELAYVIYNLEHGIKFERNKEGFEYFFEGERHLYFPDYIERGVYIEVKGYPTKRDKAKIDSFKRPLKVLYKKEMGLALDYVVKKYGRRFIKLYEQSGSSATKEVS